MIKHFCDNCGAAITKINTWKDTAGLTATIELKNVNILVTISRLCPEVEVCKYCVLDAFARLDDRGIHEAKTGE